MIFQYSNYIFPGYMDPEFYLFGKYGPVIPYFLEIWTRNSIFAGDKTRNSICPRDMDWEVYFPGDINLILGTGQNLRVPGPGFQNFTPVNFTAWLNLQGDSFGRTHIYQRQTFLIQYTRPEHFFWRALIFLTPYFTATKFQTP